MHELALKAPSGVVSRALAVLETLARERQPVRLSALAARLSMQKSTTHRALATLVRLGYAEQDPESGRYRATLRIWELGAGLVAQHPIKRAAATFVQRLHQTTGETVSLTILSGPDVLYLDRLVAARQVRFAAQIGSRFPAALTAGGKAMLAYEPDATVAIAHARESIQSTPAAGSDSRLRALDALPQELVIARHRGYATSSSHPAVMSFGAPVLATTGRATGAISVSAPRSRVSEAKRQAIVDHLLGTCADLAERTGDL